MKHRSKKRILKVFKAIKYPKINIIYTDIIFTWRFVFLQGGAWLPTEKLMHINVLKLKAILLALTSFAKTSQKHTKIMSGNTTEIHCINKMGTSHSMECHHQVRKIWEWAIRHKNHLSAAHIQGKLNTIADNPANIILDEDVFRLRLTFWSRLICSP